MVRNVGTHTQDNTVCIGIKAKFLHKTSLFNPLSLSKQIKPPFLTLGTARRKQKRGMTGTTSGAVVGRSAAAPKFFFKNLLHQKFRPFSLFMNPVSIF
jgi:hypothetical protein